MFLRSTVFLMFFSLGSLAWAAEAAPVPPASMLAPAPASSPVAVPAPAPAPVVVGMAASPVMAPVVATTSVVAPAPMVSDPAPAPSVPAVPAPDAPIVGVSLDAQPESGQSTDVVSGPAASPDAPKSEVSVQGDKTPAKVQDSWWKVLLGGLLNVVLLFLGAIATGTGAMLLKWLASKIKLSDAQVLEEAEKLYDKMIWIGINYAEQQAKKLSDDPDAKGKRLVWAVELVQSLIKDLGLAEKTADWISARIEAKLGEQSMSKSSDSPLRPPAAAGK